MNDILIGILRAGYYVVTIYYYLIFANIILSWTSYRSSNIAVWIESITSPYLNLFRNKVIIGMLDLGPLLGLLLLQFLLLFLRNF